MCSSLVTSALFLRICSDGESSRIVLVERVRLPRLKEAVGEKKLDSNFELDWERLFGRDPVPLDGISSVWPLSFGNDSIRRTPGDCGERKSSGSNSSSSEVPDVDSGIRECRGVFILPMVDARLTDSKILDAPGRITSKDDKKLFAFLSHDDFDEREEVKLEVYYMIIFMKVTKNPLIERKVLININKVSGFFQFLRRNEHQSGNL